LVIVITFVLAQRDPIKRWTVDTLYEDVKWLLISCHVTTITKQHLNIVGSRKNAFFDVEKHWTKKRVNSLPLCEWDSHRIWFKILCLSSASMWPILLFTFLCKSWQKSTLLWKRKFYFLEYFSHNGKNEFILLWTNRTVDRSKFVWQQDIFQKIQKLNKDQ